ncbi:MAG TPA: antibiotic biosynthesis monooxygenase [Deltaproteobacteria bacterium]|jgi:quinol monooxygenase YgiN|nr:antibiotic biosynthesis monooxygenase [Deltaproteobacteria bacterium]
MIYVIATVTVIKGKRTDFLEEFRKVLPLVHKEAGCIEYGPTIDVNTGIPAQKLVRDNVITIMEKWESIEALQAHLTAPHMTVYRTRVKDLVVSTAIRILRPA